VIDILSATLRLSCPILFAALGGLLCEASGISALCLEGVLLLSAFVSASVAYWTQDIFLSLLSGLISGGFLMSLHAFLTQKANSHSIVSGMALNLLVAGLTPFLCKIFFGNTTNTPSLSLQNRMMDGSIFSHHPLVVLSLFLPWILHFIFFHTRFGLHLRSAGEGPQALETSGVGLFKVRLLALFWGGIITSLGCIYLSLGHSRQFLRDMSAGRGFIALAAIILGGWKPLPTLLAALLFGFTEALQINLQNISLAGYSLPFQLTQCLPYLITLGILALSVRRNQAPKALT